MGFDALLFGVMILCTIQVLNCIVTITNNSIQSLDAKRKLQYTKDILLDYLMNNNELPMIDDKINNSVLRLPTEYHQIRITTTNKNVYVHENSIGDDRIIFSLHINNQYLHAYSGELRLLKKHRSSLNVYTQHNIQKNTNSSWQHIKLV